MAIQKHEAGFEDEKSEKMVILKSAPGHKRRLNTRQGSFFQKGQKGDKHRFFIMAKFTLPKIRRNKEKWYVEYHFDIPPELFEKYGTMRKRFKVYEDINRQDPEKKERYARLLRDAVELSLRTGFNPYQAELDKLKAEQEVLRQTYGKPILKVLEDYIAAKTKEGLKAIGSFKTTINHFTKWIALKEWQDRGVKLFTEDDIIEFLETWRDQEEWSAGTYNTNRTYVFMWFNWFVLQKIIPVSPLTKRIATATKTAVTRNEDYQGRVRELVNKELDKDPILKRLCQGVYYTCARSYKELCYIKIWHVDRAGKLIKVPDGKTGYRHIPLCDELEYLLFNEMKIDTYPHEHYIFGADAVPGPRPANKNHFSNRYKKLKDKLLLGTEYSIYGWKHTRVCDLLASGRYTDHEVMELTGHVDTRSFDKYKRGLGRRITNKLKGKTISFS